LDAAAYRETLVRQISQHAHSEIVGMLPEGNWITRAPSLERKCILMAKVQDEAGHGLYLYSAAETLGTSRDEMIDALLERPCQVFEHLQLSDADVGRRRRDRLARRRRRDHQPDSADALLVRAVRARDGARLQRRELPPTPGLRSPDDAVHGTPEQKALAQDALDRWWWPAVMMFGPPDAESQAQRTSMRWKIKLFTNDELRQKFVDQTVRRKPISSA
jgi:ring-1,2-phenylacetyl-CoA epoxidase subunit PaaA